MEDEKTMRLSHQVVNTLVEQDTKGWMIIE